MKDVTIKKTDDVKKLYTMFHENGLEVDPEGPDAPEGVIECWEINSPDGELIAGAELEKRDGEFVVGGIAVCEEHRKEHIGQALMETAIGKVKEMDGDRLMLVAKVPGFYKKLGFKTITREESPDISHCFQCDQYQVDCFPEIMVLDIK